MALNAIRRTFTDRHSSTSGPTDSSEDSPPRVRMDPNRGRVSLEKCLVMPYLDCPFLPGMLYDARSHTIFPQSLSQKKLRSTKSRDRTYRVPFTKPRVAHG